MPPMRMVMGQVTRSRLQSPALLLTNPEGLGRIQMNKVYICWQADLCGYHFFIFFLSNKTYLVLALKPPKYETIHRMRLQISINLYIYLFALFFILSASLWRHFLSFFYLIAFNICSKEKLFQEKMPKYFLKCRKTNRKQINVTWIHSL